MNESQQNSSDELTIKEQFEFEIQLWKRKLTEQFLVDLKSIENSFEQIIKQKQTNGQPFQQEKQKIIEEQGRFAEIYKTKIQQLKNLQYEGENRLKRYEIPDLHDALQHLKEQTDELNLDESVNLFHKLIQKQTQTIDQLESYLNALCERIKHENYFNQQQQIEQYLKRQKEIFFERKEQIREIVNKARKEREIWYNAARKLCQDKQNQINQLQVILNRKSKELQTSKNINSELVYKETKLYQDIQKQTLSFNANLLNIKSEVSDENKTKKLSHQASQKQFKSKNLGSIIEPLPQPQKENPQNPSLIFPSQISSSSTESKVPVVKISSSMEREVNNQKYIILILFILTIALWFV